MVCGGNVGHMHLHRVVCDRIVIQVFRYAYMYIYIYIYVYIYIMMVACIMML